MRGKRREHIAKYLIKAAKRRAQEKGVPFDLDEHLVVITERTKSRRCELSGIPLKIAEGQRDYDSISIDRIVPEKGYTIDNVRIVCWAINAAAGTWGLEKALEIMKKIKI